MPIINADGPARTHRSEVSLGGGLQRIDGRFGQLGALQKRWEDGVTGKNLRDIGEAYASGRLSLVFELEATSVGLAVSDPVDDPASANSKGRLETVVVHVINQDGSNLSHRDTGDDEVVFVDIVGLPDFPERKVASLVRLYSGQKLEGYEGERLHYATCGCRAFSLFGRGEGLTKSFPGFIGREVYARRVSGLRHHQAGDDVFQGTAETVERVSDREDQISWYRLGNCADRLMPGLRVRIIENAAEITFAVGREPLLRLVDVSVGPIDF